VDIWPVHLPAIVIEALACSSGKSHSRLFHCLASFTTAPGYNTLTSFTSNNLTLTYARSTGRSMLHWASAVIAGFSLTCGVFVASLEMSILIGNRDSVRNAPRNCIQSFSIQPVLNQCRCHFDLMSEYPVVYLDIVRFFRYPRQTFQHFKHQFLFSPSTAQKQSPRLSCTAATTLPIYIMTCMRRMTRPWVPKRPDRISHQHHPNCPVTHPCTTTRQTLIEADMQILLDVQPHCITYQTAPMTALPTPFQLR
jgi:hypothetical protein